MIGVHNFCKNLLRLSTYMVSDYSQQLDNSFNPSDYFIKVYSVLEPSNHISRFCRSNTACGSAEGTKRLCYFASASQEDLIVPAAMLM